MHDIRSAVDTWWSYIYSSSQQQFKFTVEPDNDALPLKSFNCKNILVVLGVVTLG